MQIGDRIRELRQTQGLSTNKLANLAGISQSYLRDIELGNKNPTVEILSYICDALNITLQTFFTVIPIEYSPLLMDAVTRLSLPEQEKLADFILAMRP